MFKTCLLYTSVGTCYVVHQGLNKTSFKADKFLLLVASSVVLLLIAIFVIYVNARILEQVAIGFIPVSYTHLFLSNTIESYKGIAEDREKIDELMFSDED